MLPSLPLGNEATFECRRIVEFAILNMDSAGVAYIATEPYSNQELEEVVWYYWTMLIKSRGGVFHIDSLRFSATAYDWSSFIGTRVVRVQVSS